MKKEKTVNADRITYAQLSRLTGTRDKRTARTVENCLFR